MSKITKKYIGTAQVGANQVRLENNSALLARNAADDNDVQLLMLNSSDELEFQSHPYVLGAATQPNQVARQAEVTDAQNAADAAQADATTALANAATAQSTADTANSNAAAAQADATQALADAAAAQADATQALADAAAAQSTADGRLATDMSNLVAITAIPASTSALESLNTSQTFATEFKIKTIDQTSSVSGSLRMLSGNVAGDFVSGGARVSSGNNTNASRATAATTATGVASIGSGSISGGTQGSTGQATLFSGSISAAISGNTGAVNMFSGGISNAGATGETGAVFIGSGTNISQGNSGRIVIETGNASNAGGGNSGQIIIDTGRSMAANSGQITIATGGISATPRFPGDIDNSSNESPTGDVNISTGLIENAGSSADTGNINLSTGSNAGSGSQGQIHLYSSQAVIHSQMDMSNFKIVNLDAPTDPGDAATKAYVDAQVSAGVSSDFEKIVLSPTDIANQYIDLSEKYVIGSLDISCARVVLNASDAVDADYDFQGDNSGLVTRLIFQGPSAAGQAEELVSGDVLFIKGILGA